MTRSDGRGSGVGMRAKLIGIAVTLVLILVPVITAVADLGDAPPPETHYPAGSGQLEGTELVEEQAGLPCFRATRTLFGLRGAGTFEGRAPSGDSVVYRAQIAPGQTLYGDGPLQVQLENTEPYYHSPFGTHGTEAGGGAGCSPTTAGTPVPAEFRIFAAEGWVDTDGDTDVDVLTGAASVYRLDDAGDKVPCVGRGSFARGSEVSGSAWVAEWTLSADCVVVGNQGAVPGTGTAPRGTSMTNHGDHAPCFDVPCANNLRIDYKQFLPKPGPYLRLSGPTSVAVGCDRPVTVTARLTDTGWPASGVPVTFSVAGPGAAVPPGGTANTDQNGEAGFSFTAATAGDYTVTATATLDGQEASATHTVRFSDVPPLRLALAGPDRSQTEEPLAVTATVSDACGPLPGAQVDFAVAWPAQDLAWTGQANPDSGRAITGADGRASFSFSGNRAGDYRITASTRLPSGEEASDTDIVRLEIRTLKRVGAIDLPTAESRMAAAVMDPAGRYAYFGSGGSHVVKVDLATFQRVGAITLQGPDGGQVSLSAAVIDPAGRYAYFGASQPFVVKVDLATFEVVGTLALAPNESAIASALIDPTGRYAYFGTSAPDGRIVKVDLATLTRVGAIETKVGDQDHGYPYTGVMDPGGRYAYFGSSDHSNAWVLKVDLATFQVGDVIGLPRQEYWPVSAVIDPAGDFAYFGTEGAPGRVVKVDLRSFQRVGAITLPSGERLVRFASPAVIGPTGDFAYFGTAGTREITGAHLPGGVVKIDLRMFQRVHAITLEPDSSENWLASAVVDPAGNYVYGGTAAPEGTVPGTRPPDRAVKVQLERPPNPALVAGHDAYGADAGTTLTVAAPGVLANDTDTADGDALQAGQASEPAGGSVTLNPNGAFTYTPDLGFAGTDTFTYTATDGMDYSAPATVTVAVALPTGVTGRAFGYHADDISLFGGAQPDTGPTPTVALASDGSNSPQSATASTGLVQYGPATLFTSDQVDVSSAVGSGGDSLVTSTALTNVNQATTQASTGSEVLTADRIEGRCTASATARSGSTTITNGTVRTKAQDPSFPDEGLVTVPADPPANYTVDGYVFLSSTSRDNYRIAFNEQVTNPDGSITVNAVHEYFLGPVLVGDLVLGQSVCGWGATSPPTTTTTTSTTTTSTTTTTVPTTTTTAPKGKGGGGPKPTTTTTTTPSSPPADLAVSISDTPDPVTVGANVTYTVVVTNAGPSPATGVSLALTLNGTTYVSSSGASCATGKGKGAGLRCDLGSLGSGASATVTVVAKAPTKPATVSATASVSATTTDPATANNADTESTAVVK